MAETALDIELSRFAEKRDHSQDRAHIFITGLARAGTTLLMRLLYDTGQFCSLTYRDMPFVLAPNSWEGLVAADRRQTDVRERAHGDGLMVSSDSPEALEEVFWRVTCGRQYIKADSLVPMTADDEVIDQFRKYINVILYRYGGDRYLSKNNNNILRIPTINRAFPSSVVLVPFREPLQHASSLLGQHQHFSEVQRRDRFVRKYMNWLGHHEFGEDHRPFEFDGSKPSNPGAVDVIDYWLERWSSCYSWLLERAGAGDIQVLFFCYEHLCADPGGYQARLFECLELEGGTSGGIEIIPPATAETGQVDSARAGHAREIYAELVALSRSKLE